jgi:tetratricopeptide (TPR) repeat protein
MYRLSLTVAALFAAVACAYAQDYRVQYIEGLVEVQRNAAWYQAAEGDQVSRGALVRLDDGAFVELAGGGATLRLTRRGTYDLNQLAAADTQARSAGVGAFLAQRARAMAAPTESTPRHQVGVAGARGDDKSATGPIWAGQSSTGDLIAEGTRKLSSGSYHEAYAIFADAQESASGPDLARVTFLMGYAAYLDGDVSRALRALQEPAPDPAASHYDDHVLVLAQILVETFAYEDAADLLQRYLRPGKAAGDNAQAARLLLGMSFKGLGSRERAAETLRAAQAANPSSPAGRAAAKLLESL